MKHPTKTDRPEEATAERSEEKMTKKTFVFSYPRSGLHLLAKILNRPLYVNFNAMEDENHVRQKIQDPGDEVLFNHKTMVLNGSTIVNEIMSGCNPIFLFRDPKDTLLSWYFLFTEKKEEEYTHESFKEFINSPFVLPKKPSYESKMLLWKDHVVGYKETILNGNAFVLRYENLLNHFDEEKVRLEAHIGRTIETQTLPNPSEVEMSRNGTVGDHRRFLDPKTIALIDEACSDEMAFIDGYLRRGSV